MPSVYDLKMPRIKIVDQVAEDEAQAFHRAWGGCSSDIGGWDGCITSRSPKAHIKAVYQIARYLRREFGYDLTPYSETAPDPAWRAYVWTSPADYWHDETETVVGACLFAPSEYHDVSAEWELCWVWFHPFERNKGHLTRAWDYFQRRHGHFWVQHPLSRAMRGFLSSRSYELPPVTE